MTESINKIICFAEVRIIELYIYSFRNNIACLTLSRPEHYLMTVCRTVHVNPERVHFCAYISAIILRVLFCILQKKLDILCSDCFVIHVFLHTLAQ